ncbi:MAG: FAD-binding oxidoreductase [Parvibaculaceae bacterium]|nr:FAD-binding oxidoreductase [Parvibaculaceae bacterium]
MTIDRQTLRWNGWGPAKQENPLPDGAPQWAWIKETLGMAVLPSTPAKRLSDITLPPCHLSAGEIKSLEDLVGENQVRTDDYERAFHARGKSYHDLLYVRAGDLDVAPDAVVYPRAAGEVQSVLAYCAENDMSVVPFGGGSSVVGGVNATARSATDKVITLDLTLMDGVHDVDRVAMTARIDAGIYGPHLEEKLNAQGLTLGHYPQSFEYSTLGGWIAARGAGQQSNRYGKAEKWVVSTRLATPNGPWSTEEFPASAAGPNLNQLVAGSEGTLGVICDATVKIHEKPQAKDYRGYLFKDFATGVEVARSINHADIPVAMVRLSDAAETYFFQTFGSSSTGGLKSKLQNAYLKWKGFTKDPCLMLIGLEGDKETVEWAKERTGTICKKAGALAIGSSAGDRWYHGRFSSPYSRDPMMDRGIGVDTLETATPWSNILKLHEKMIDAIQTALDENMGEPGQKGIVMGHVSHSYPDGASLYFTFVFPRDLKDEVGQWQRVKRAASDAIAANGGTISHHHGVGADHTPWMAEEKGAMGMTVLKTLKAELDPKGIMNPGKLFG